MGKHHHGTRLATNESWSNSSGRSNPQPQKLWSTLAGHYHALGRDHRTWYDRERPQLFADALKAVKQQLDPHHILNRGILID
jgi:alkyldihydroxyacetonephosphate synthase